VLGAENTMAVVIAAGNSEYIEVLGTMSPSSRETMTKTNGGLVRSVPAITGNATVLRHLNRSADNYALPYAILHSVCLDSEHDP
jgi:hypothetical protein